MTGSHTSTLHIAGVRFEIDSPLPVAWPDADGAYAAFFAPSQGPCEPLDVCVRLERGAAQPPAGAQPIFETNSWILSLHGSRRVIARKPAGGHDSLWTARIEAGFGEVVVTCSAALATRRADRDAFLCPVCYPLDQLLLMYALSVRSGLLVHAAGAEFAGRAVLFPGVSGAGKSTLARCLLAHGAARMLSDDRIVVRSSAGPAAGAGCFAAFGTPWPGDAGIAVNAGAPLSAVMLLAQSPCTALRRLEPAEALERLLPAVSLPWYDRAVLPAALGTCEALASHVPCWELAFVPEPGVADAILATLL